MVNQRKVNRFVKVTALINKLDKERKAIREEILQHVLEDGEEIPNNGPSLVEAITTTRTSISWKGVAEQLATECKATKRLKRIVDGAPEVESTSLIVRPNPNWKS